jgi:hypothetical protein
VKIPTDKRPGQSAKVVFRQIPPIVRALWHGGGIIANLRIVNGVLLMERAHSAAMNCEFVGRSPIRYGRHKRALRRLRLSEARLLAALSEAEAAYEEASTAYWLASSQFEAACQSGDRQRRIEASKGTSNAATVWIMALQALVMARRAAAPTRPWPAGVLPCDVCGQSNPVWFAPSDVWNLVMGGPDATDDPGGYLCPCCFIRKAEDEGYETTAWVLTPESK